MLKWTIEGTNSKSTSAKEPLAFSEATWTGYGGIERLSGLVGELHVERLLVQPSLWPSGTSTSTSVQHKDAVFVLQNWKNSTITGG